jgi:3-oxoacyl-[acyl-carrier-protein] synthase-3
VNKIVIEKLSYVEAPNVMTSLEIESRFKDNMNRFGLPDNFLATISGVKERREWEEGFSVTDAAILSAKKLLMEYSIDPNEIGCIINSSVSRDYVEPTISVMAHNELKLNDRCINFDVNSACLGFSNSVNIISNMLQAKQINYGLIINGESSKRVLDLTTERLSNPNISLEDFMLEFATLTLGSGSVSMLLCREEDSKGNGHTIEESMFSVDSRFGMLCKGDHSQMICNSHDMLKEGIYIVDKTWAICTKEFKKWNNDIDLYIPHQVSMTHSKVLSKHTNTPLEKMELIFPTHGNIGPAAWPIALQIAENKGRINKGSEIGILSMGSGFNCACMRVVW